MPSDTRVDQLRGQVEALCGELSRAFAWNNELRHCFATLGTTLERYPANSVLDKIIKDLNAEYDELVAHAAAVQAKLDASVLNETARGRSKRRQIRAVALGTSLAGFSVKGRVSSLDTSRTARLHADLFAGIG